ncbi:LacI family DNA-binding transcriptional regulator [Carboxylicivirga sp. M1479]|uniref:LacI family DNA-binding transcriptional regulator n=1 Tax=Carboxylicivirga sp. M1479 TaxID=2594476 RepID=UPI0011786869|nr:LacI family DNA-binding transcriptional regulator [Carboxylicivirga sp. M1479]TRX66075.1 substrate-binding domain-containing protein [Carboxylicivirga sp. M1479]
MAKQVRIKDIAIKAGVSAGTVDRVLHNRGEVKPETKELILKIAKELDYKPNVAARLLKAPAEYKIGVLLPKPVNDKSFWTNHPIGINQAIANSLPYNIKADFYEFSLEHHQDFLQRAEELMAAKPHGVILAPLYKDESQTFIKRLDELKIPYVFIDTNIDGVNPLTYIGEDAMKSGRIAASLVDAITPVDKDILIVNIAKSLVNTQHLNSRNQGFMAYFMESGLNKGLKINVDIPSDKNLEVKGKLDTVLSANTNIGAILVSGSRTYVVANYLENAGLDHVLVGYESIDENIKYLNSGTINFLVSQRPVEQAEKALQFLVDHLVNKNEIPNNHFQPVDIVNKEWFK